MAILLSLQYFNVISTLYLTLLDHFCKDTFPGHDAVASFIIYSPLPINDIADLSN